MVRFKLERLREFPQSKNEAASIGRVYQIYHVPITLDYIFRFQKPLERLYYPSERAPNLNDLWPGL